MLCRSDFSRTCPAEAGPTGWWFVRLKPDLQVSVKERVKAVGSASAEHVRLKSDPQGAEACRLMPFIVPGGGNLHGR